jgi:hypothetical protein
MLASFEEDPLRDDYPDELVDEDLRAAGMDPAVIRAEGAALGEALLEQRRQAWRKKAKDELTRAREIAAGAPRIPREPRSALLERLAAVQRNPRYTGHVTAMFRGRPVEELTDEDLAGLLEELGILERIDDDEEPR